MLGFEKVITLTESLPSAIKVRASVLINGIKHYSSTRNILVKVEQDPDSVLPQVATHLEAGDIEGALKFFKRSPRVEEGLAELDEELRSIIAAAYRTARLVREKERVRTYEVTMTFPKAESKRVEVSLVKSKTGQWLIPTF